MYVCMYACVYKFHSENQVPLLLFRRSTRSNPPWMFFECRHWGLYLFISLFMHLYLYFNEKNLKPCKMFSYVCIYVCMFACVYNFHSETQVPLLLFHRSTRSNPPSMFFECRRRGSADAWYKTGNVWEGIGVQPWFLKKSFKLWFYNLFIYFLNRKVYCIAFLCVKFCCF